jgi:hypothetical protein
MERSGRLRVIGPDGRCFIRYRLTDSAIAVRAETHPRRASAAFHLRCRPPISIRCATRQHGDAGSSAQSESGFWDLQPGGRSFESLCARFGVLLEGISAGNDAPPSRARTRARIWATKLLRALGREAVRRCDPRARELAMTFAAGMRFWVYRHIAADATGRIGQMASICPGLLLVVYGLSATELRSSGRGSALLDGIVAGRRLPNLLSIAAAHSLEEDVLSCWSGSPASARLRYLSSAERAAAAGMRRLLLRRAGPLVGVADLLEVPPARFDPEDVPRHPVRNACWFRTMRRTQFVVGGVWEVELRERLSSFASANAALLAARASRRGYPADELGEVDGPGVTWLIQRVVRFARATGRVPTRGTNARRYLGDCERWWLAQARDTPAAGLGELLRRIPALGLGEVTSVRALRSDDAFDGLERITLPRSPAPSVSVPGLTVRPIDTPEALADEGSRMAHCVASWLPLVMAGETWLYSARAGDVPITVAIQRAGAAGAFRMLEARLANDLRPDPHQRRLLGAWIRALNASLDTP